MRARWNVLPIILALCSASRGQADTRIENLRFEATRAYRAGRYDLACPLFAQLVTASKFDAWAWNDLALCRTHQLAFDQVLEPLDKATALEKVVADEPLKKAIATNQSLLSKALLAHPKAKGAALPAAIVGVRRFDANDLATACPLLALAVSREEEVILDADEWRRIGACRLESKAPALEVLDALRRARAGDASVEALVHILSDREEAARVESDTDWRKHCFPLDGKACGRRWLLCAKNVPSEDEEYRTSSTEWLVIIEAATLGQWKRVERSRFAAEMKLQS